MNTLSVIIPAYNAAAYIADCLDSILAATKEKPCEIIVVDDGSTDETAEIVAAYEDRGVMLLKAENGGTSKARNAGLDVAKGHYVAFVDADDMVGVDFLTLIDVAQKTEADIVCGGICNDIIKLGTGTGKISVMSHNKAIERGLYQAKMNISCYGKVYKRMMFANVRFVEGMRYEDLEIFPRIFAKAFKVACVDKNIYYYRPNSQSFINQYSPARLHVLDVTDKIIEQCKEDENLCLAARDRSFAANFNMFLLTSKWMADHSQLKTVHLGCWQKVRLLRGEVLLNGKSRAKNRIGAFVSYFGPSCVKFINSVFAIV